jgi:undecaprenyl-diphosphatase
MGGWIDAAIALVAENPEWALFIAFAAAVIEAVAVLGILVPGTPLVMAVAGAAAAAEYSMVPYLILVFLGAMIGDFISYGLGYRYRDRLRGFWILARRPGLMEAADRFFARHGGMSVVFCRFLPVLRCTVPLVAGMTRMNLRRFAIANIGSAALWSPVHVYPGLVAGMTIERLNKGDTDSALLWGAGLVAICVAFWLLHRRLAGRAR